MEFKQLDVHRLRQCPDLGNELIVLVWYGVILRAKSKGAPAFGKERTMGRKAGSKDNNPRSAGRWSDQTRARLGKQKAQPQKQSQPRPKGQPSISFPSSAGAGSSSDAGLSAAQQQNERPEVTSEQDQQQRAQQQQHDEQQEVDQGSPEQEAQPEDEMDEPDEPGAARPEPQEPVDPVDIDDDEGLRAADARDSITMQYFRAVLRRLKLERSSRTSTPAVDPWLVRHLKAGDFWLRSIDALKIYTRLGVEIDGFDVDYVRDLRVWLPHVQYGHMAFCPGCGSNTDVGVHGFRDEGWVARRVTKLGLDYCIMSCRYICHACAYNAATAKQSIRAAADARAPPVIAFPIIAQHIVMPSAPAAMAEERVEVVTSVAGICIGDMRTPMPRHIANRKRGPDRPKPDGEKRIRTCKGCGSQEWCPGRWRVENCTNPSGS
jgi:hypothetical protein